MRPLTASPFPCQQRSSAPERFRRAAGGARTSRPRGGRRQAETAPAPRGRVRSIVAGLLRPAPDTPGQRARRGRRERRSLRRPPSPGGARARRAARAARRRPPPPREALLSRPVPLPRSTAACLAALAGVVTVLALGDPRAAAAPFVAATVAWGALVAVLAPNAGSVPTIAVAALLVRAPLLALPPTLSDDVWRYLWEGAVWRAGHNPFVHAPDAAALAPLRDAVWAHVNHRHVPSIYPPAAQALFVALADGGVLAWRLVSAAADIVTAVMLARARPRAGWLWALLPLPALESAVSGHLEGIGVAFLVAAVVSRRGVHAWFGAMIKLLPGVLLALEPRRRWLGWALLTLAVCAPVVRPEGFEIYRTNWSFNGSIFPLAQAAIGDWARPTLQLVGAAIVAAILLRSRDPARVALWTTGAFVALSPTVHPWYVLWPLASALLAGSWSWLVLAVTIPGAYVVLATYDPATNAWSESVLTRWAIWVPFYGALAREAWTRLTRAGPSAVH